MWSTCWHPVHLFTSGGRVALGTSDLPGSVPASSLVPPPSLCSGRGVGTSRVPAGESAAARVCREAGGRVSTSAWLISIFFRQGGSTTGRLRLWQTDFLCSMARNSQWTQPWCLLSEGMGVLVVSVLTTMEQLWSKHDARRKTPTLSWPAHGAAERVEIGGRWSDEARDFVRPAGNPRNCEFQSDTLGSAVGAHCWLAALLGPSASPFWSTEVDLAWTERPPQPQPCLRSSDMSVWTGERATAGSG